MDANNNLTILSSDLVYGEHPTYLTHFMAQSAFAGKIPKSFLNANALFKPVHAEDLSKAVDNKLTNGGNGHFAVRGNDEISIKDFLNVVEKACGKSEG